LASECCALAATHLESVKGKNRYRAQGGDAVNEKGGRRGLPTWAEQHEGARAHRRELCGSCSVF
jgi:hypothetical protein